MQENPMIDTRTPPFAALLLRLALGVMFVSHGLQKLLIFTPAGTAKFFASVGFPGSLADPVIAAETIGGVLLILGVFPRCLAGVLALELLGAAAVHLHNGWGFTPPHGG